MKDDSLKKGVIDSYDIDLAIKDFARSRRLLTGDIDFDIIKTTTNALGVGGDVIMFSCEDKEKFLENFLDDQAIQMKQIYQLRLKQFKEGLPVLHLNSNADDTEVSVTLKKGCDLSIYPDVAKLIYDEINKKLARSKFIIYHFEQDLKEQIDNFTAQNVCCLAQDVTFKVSSAFAFRHSVDGVIELAYAKKDAEAHKDMYERDFTKEVKKGDLLISYKKPIMGVNGRNCKGVFMECAKPNDFEPQFKYDESIIAREDDFSINYFATKNGFVNHDEYALAVNDSLSLNSINAKATGSIASKNSQDTSINVSEENPAMDAIGPSMTVRVAQLSVKGSVAEKATIIADEVEIMGMTHASSRIEASAQVKIRSHRGYAKSQFAEIENLEGGEIVCDVVNIVNARSGSITAKKVFIEKLESNCKISASELIQIDEICGDGNDLYITSSLGAEYKKQSDTIKKQILHTKELIKQDIERLKKLMQTIGVNKEKVDKLKAANEIQENPSHQEIIKKFRHLVVSAKKLQTDVEAKKEAIADLGKQLAKLLDSALQAKVIIGSQANGSCKIRFQAPDGNDYLFTQTSMSDFLSIHLCVAENGSFCVKEAF